MEAICLRHASVASAPFLKAMERGRAQIRWPDHIQLAPLREAEPFVYGHIDVLLGLHGRVYACRGSLARDSMEVA
jgi:hypothetical protein